MLTRTPKINILLITIFLVTNSTVFSQKQAVGFRFEEYFDKKQLDVTYNGKLLTAYCYFDSIMKPVLFPINTVSGITVTRGFPLAPRPGERVDHPHHVGMWLNYESVNGLDFWNNSTAIPYNKRSHYGSIVHEKFITTKVEHDKALLKVSAVWLDHARNILLNEITTYTFQVVKENFIIDRSTQLTAATDVVFKDVKDGLLGFRVARELEHVSDKPETFVDDKGNYTSVPVIDNKGVTGMYLSSEGLKGNDVWGTRGRWTSLSGTINREPVSVTIVDHPKNVGYPTYWHARGYGLFAANPLGQEVFSEGREKLNLTLKKGQSVTFNYRVVIRSGEVITVSQIEKLAKGMK